MVGKGSKNMGVNTNKGFRNQICNMYKALNSMIFSRFCKFRL